MIGKNFFVKIVKKILNIVQKISHENSLPLQKFSKIEMISFCNDDNDRIYIKAWSKSIKPRTDFKVIRILAGTFLA